MPGKFFVKLRKGDILRIETPGGGGYGDIKPDKNKKI
jgi:N-methylhydantoinase B/oxoprolinase/acetone carboxylase alpha subunit